MTVTGLTNVTYGSYANGVRLSTVAQVLQLTRSLSTAINTGRTHPLTITGTDINGNAKTLSANITLNASGQFTIPTTLTDPAIWKWGTQQFSITVYLSTGATETGTWNVNYIDDPAVEDLKIASYYYEQMAYSISFVMQGHFNKLSNSNDSQINWGFGQGVDIPSNIVGTPQTHYHAYPTRDYYNMSIKLTNVLGISITTPNFALDTNVYPYITHFTNSTYGGTNVIRVGDNTQRIVIHSYGNVNLNGKHAQLRKDSTMLGSTENYPGYLTLTNTGSNLWTSGTLVQYLTTAFGYFGTLGQSVIGDISITVVEDPIITSLQHTVDLATRTITFTASVTGNHNNSWELFFGDGDSQTFTRNTFTVSHRYASYGQYTITLRVKNTLNVETTLTIYISVLPNPLEVVGSDDHIRLVRADGRVLGILNGVNYSRYSKTPTGDSWEVGCYPSKDHLQAMLNINDDPENAVMLYIPVLGYYRACVIESIYYDGDIITVSGDEYTLALFKRRMCLTDINSGDGYDTRTGAAETLLRYWMLQNIPSTEPRKDDNWFLLDDDLGRGGDTTYSARLETTLKVLQSLFEASSPQLGFESYVIGEPIDGVGVSVGCHIIQSVDRRVKGANREISTADSVFLSEANGTIELTGFTRNFAPNVCYGGGFGQAPSRLVLPAGNVAASDVSRWEIFQDCKEASRSGDIVAMAERILASAARFAVTIKPQPNSMYMFGRPGDGGHYYVGDTVTIDCGDFGVFDAPVASAEIAKTVDGEELVLTLGTVETGVAGAITDTRDYIKDARR